MPASTYTTPAWSLNDSTFSPYTDGRMAKISSTAKKFTQRVSMVAAASLVLVGTATVYAIARSIQTNRQETKVAAQVNTPTKPSQVFDLTYWKLTLPINGAQEIKQPELDSYTSQYFKLNDAKNGITFMSPAGGDTTGGSNYARSELRERRDRSNPYTFTEDCTETKKQEEACWGSGIGYHIMTIEQTITHIPKEKPHVVVGQIHDDKDDNFVFRLEGTKLFVDANRYKSQIGNNGEIPITSNYQLGTPFTVAFEVVNDVTYFYYNGQRVGSIPTRYSNGYFKAGMYVQSNEGKGAYGSVDIHNVKVCHAESKNGCTHVQPQPPGESPVNPTMAPTPSPSLTPTPAPTGSPVPTKSPSPTKSPNPTQSPLPTTTPKPGNPPATGKVSNLKVTSPADSKVVLTWDAYPEAKEYKVLLSQNSPSKFKAEKETSKTTINFNLKSCKNYYFRVEAYDKKGKKIAISDIGGVLVSIGKPVHPCE